MESGDGGWIVLVRRTPNVAERLSFDRNWVEYEQGFGNLSGEFWYGLKNIYCLTSRKPMEVEVEVSKTDSTKLDLSYGNFKWMDLIQATHCMCRTNSMEVMISFGVTTEINSRLLTETMTNTTPVVQYNSTEVGTGLVAASICISLTCRNLSFIMKALISTTTLSYECVPKVI